MNCSFRELWYQIIAQFSILIGDVQPEKYFYSKTNYMHRCLKCILFIVTLYMFRTVSIIRSSRLYIQQQACVKEVLLSAC